MIDTVSDAIIYKLDQENTALKARVKQLEDGLSDLIYSLNFRSKVDKDKARQVARGILENNGP